MRGGGGVAEGTFYPIGAYKVCPVCGKVFFVLELQKWVFQRTVRWNKRTTEKTVYFCTWGCLRKYEADIKRYNEEVKDKAANEKKKGRKKNTRRERRKAVREAADREGKHCPDCRYYMRDSFGFPFCTFNYGIYVNKAACGRFKQADVFDMEERNEHRKERESQRVGSR